MVVTCEVDIAVSGVLPHICQTLGLICAYKIIAVCLIFTMRSHIYSVTYQICIQ